MIVVKPNYLALVNSALISLYIVTDCASRSFFIWGCKINLVLMFNINLENEVNGFGEQILPD